MERPIYLYGRTTSLVATLHNLVTHWDGARTFLTRGIQTDVASTMPLE